jgi:hypothetical protein
VSGPIATPIEEPRTASTELLSHPREVTEVRPELDARRFRIGVAGLVAAVGAFLISRLTAWPPHEDETLALYVANGSLGELADTVLGERGGAPLHFVFAWLVAHSGGGLPELRLISAAFALASIPVVAALAARLTDRTVGLLATAFVSTSWVLLFHGIYARMYSLFLFTSVLSYLALLAALRNGGRRSWVLWGAAVLATVATHPYGALVLASQALYVLLARQRVREALVGFGAVAVLGIPFWITDLVLAGRFDVGLGGGGEKLGDPTAILGYLRQVGEDFSAGPVALPVVLALAGFGFVLLARRNRVGALLVLSVLAAPTLAFLFARLGSNAAPETRHLIFALPFFATIVATALVHLARRGGSQARPAAALTIALLLVSGVLWAWDKTPALFAGDPATHVEGRDAASTWLAETGRPDDVLLGYDPVFLEAWDRNASFSRLVLPRADAKLASEELLHARKPLGRGVWVFDAYDTSNIDPGLRIAAALPRPASAFEARAFGPYLVLRTREPTRTIDEYLRRSAAALVLGRSLLIGDADVNFMTISRAADLLDYEPSSRSRSITSR